jgi:predicted Zn-dependent protease with MMP-like domain
MPRLSVSRGRFRRYVMRAVEDLPPRFRGATDNLIVVVESSPQPEDYSRVRGEEEGPLFGIYRGVPLAERSAGYQLAAPDVIAVFRRPLLRYCRRPAQLREEIRRTVLHEFGHYLGLEESAVEHL